ncbi:MAG: hypothetical protein EA378_00940 [Phycisphaerales bacterium]|nr:MAG: hypothetical protein EA378_00940 [Phycisphaerales bacterium]
MSVPRPDLILLGLPGSGKTTLAERLGRELGRPVIDLDDRAPAYAGCSTIAEVFERLGEASFRDAETRALADVLDAQDADAPRIIALGGGTPTAATLDASIAAADLLRLAQDERRAILVYLRLSTPSLIARLEQADNHHRPTLTSPTGLAALEAIHHTRDPLYQALAGATIECDDLNEAQSVEAVLRASRA